MSYSIVCIILGTGVSARAKKISAGIPSMPSESPRFMFSSVVRTSSSLSGHSSRGATSLMFARSGNHLRCTLPLTWNLMS